MLWLMRTSCIQKPQLTHHADLYNRTKPLKLSLFENINQIQF